MRGRARQHSAAILSLASCTLGKINHPDVPKLMVKLYTYNIYNYTMQLYLIDASHTWHVMVMGDLEEV